MEQDNIKVTNEELARMIKAGFDHVDDRFEQINGKFAQVDQRFDGLEKDVRDIGHKVNQIDRRLFSLEEDIAEMRLKRYKDLPERVSLLEKKLAVVKWVPINTK